MNMATQQPDRRHAFSIVPQENQQQFRLLELPSEVLDLITSSCPPVLQLKSPERLPGQASDPIAVLCTPDKTFNLRQVNHSNSVFVTQPSKLHAGGVSDHSALEAIAQSTFTLELNPAKGVPASAYLRGALPIYRPGVLNDHSNTVSTKARQLANIPLDQAQCERAWRELACFEIQDQKASYLPSSSSRNAAWDAMLVQALAEGIDLTSALALSDVRTLINLDGDEWPMELCQAILNSMTLTSAEGVLQLNGETCARLTGTSLLQEYASKSAYSSSAFAQKWADSLPEKWRNLADYKLLEGSYSSTTAGMITFIDKTAKEVNAVNDAAGIDAKTGTKRKWHDKFRAAKKAT